MLHQQTKPKANILNSLEDIRRNVVFADLDLDLEGSNQNCLFDALGPNGIPEDQVWLQKSQWSTSDCLDKSVTDTSRR